jgi:hypothetical protein
MPYYRQVPLELVVVDERYQRDIIPTHVENIRKDFDEAKLDVLHMSKRSETEYACLDGQHRLIVLNEREDQKTAPSLVHENLTPQQEAELFRELQEGRRQLMPLDKFKARLFHDDPVAVGIYALANEHRLEIGTGPKSIQSIVAFERVFRRGNLPETLTMLTGIWRNDPKWLEGALCDGVSRFLDLFPEADRDHARATWGDVSPTQILRNASDLVSSSKAGGVLEFLRNTYSSKKYPLPTVAKAIEERKAVQAESGRRYRRVQLSEVRDAAVDMERFTVHEIRERLGVSRASLVKRGGFLDQLVDMGILTRRRESSDGQGSGGGAYFYEYVPLHKQPRPNRGGTANAQRKSGGNGSGPRVAAHKAVQGTGKPKRRPGTRDIQRTGKR